MVVGGRDRHFPAARHGIARVGRQVDDAVFELSWIRQDGPQVGRQIERNLDVLAKHAGQQLHHPVDLPVGLHGHGPQRLAAGKGKQPGREVRSYPCRLQGLGDKFLRVQAALSCVAAKFEVADDHTEQVIEVMRDAAGHTADGVHPLHLSQLFLGVAARGDVEHRDDPVSGITIGIPHTADVHLDRKVRGRLVSVP